MENLISILYAEDEERIQRTVGRMLKRKYKNLFLANDGRDGLESFKKNKQDLIITDIRMPYLDGLSMIKKIKEIEPNTKIIVMSAYTEASYFLESIEIGVDGFLIKPVIREKLFEIVKKISETILMERNLEIKNLEIKKQNIELNEINTELEELYDNLQVSEQKYHALFDNMTSGFTLLEAVKNKENEILDFRFLEINESFRKLFSPYFNKLVIGRTIKNLKFEISNDLIEEFKNAIFIGRNIRIEYFFKKKRQYFEIFIYNPQKNQVAAIYNDITERKRYSKNLQKLNQRFSLHFKETPLAYIEWNTNLEIIDWNPSAEKIFSYNKKEIIGKNIFSLIVPDNSKNEVLSDWTNLIYKKQMSNKSTVFNLRKDGKIIICDWYNTSLRDRNGKVIGLSSLVHDITEKTEAEKKLKEQNKNMVEQKKEIESQNFELQSLNESLDDINQEIQNSNINLKKSEEKLNIILNTLPTPIFVKDAQHKWLIINDAFTKMFNIKKEELLGKKGHIFYSKKQANKIIKREEYIYSTGKTKEYEERFLDINNKKRIVISKRSLINDTDGNKILLGIITDISYIREQERRVKKTLRQQSFLSDISYEFNTAVNFSLKMKNVLKKLGFLTNVSRVYIFEKKCDNQLRKTYSWFNKKKELFIKNKTVFNILNNWKSWQTTIEKKGSIISNNIKELPEEIYKIYKAQNVKSTVVLPIFVRNEIFGFITFDECLEEKEWEKTELELLTTVSNILSNAYERKETEERIIKAKKEADAANKSKSLFLANMSHEIRTPMNAILGYSRLLSRMVNEKTQKNYIEIIQTSGKNLLAIINDILDLSKIEAGKLMVDYKSINPNIIFSDIKNIFKLKAIEKEIEFISEVDKEIPKSLLLDETRLRQILFNLVGNAIKFTSNGFVKMSVDKIYTDNEKSKLNLIFKVEDTGIGISKDQFDEIFAAFKQQKGQGNKFGGTGLGLTITKSLVEIMNGEIFFESEIGKGTIFTVLLKDVVVGSITNKINKDVFKFDKNINFLNSKVLVVEDNNYNMNLVKYILNAQNINILKAFNGQEAIEILKTEKPDLILMDMKMPIMDGYEATKIIKSNKNWKKIPLVALTAEVMKDDKEKIESIGCDAFLSKPIDEDELFNTLSKFLPYKIIDNSVKKEEKKELDKKINLSDKEIEDLKNQLNNELMVFWKKNSNSMLLHKWKEFGNMILKVGKEYKINYFIDYGKSLVEYVSKFQIKDAKKTIKNYPKMVENFFS